VHALPALLAAALLAGLPKQGMLVPGVSLAGVRLGATPAEVRSVFGTHFGRCRGCAETTWYFTYTPFQPQGAGVSFRGGRVDSVFTVWSPPGWLTSRGLVIGDDAARLTEIYGRLPRVRCGAYSAYVKRTTSVTSAIYVYQSRVWGFGLSSAGAPVCH
jgi:hypothetical protein